VCVCQWACLSAQDKLKMPLRYWRNVI